MKDTWEKKGSDSEKKTLVGVYNGAQQTPGPGPN